MISISMHLSICWSVCSTHCLVRRNLPVSTARNVLFSNVNNCRVWCSPSLERDAAGQRYRPAESSCCGRRGHQQLPPGLDALPTGSAAGKNDIRSTNLVPWVPPSFSLSLLANDARHQDGTGSAPLGPDPAARPESCTAGRTMSNPRLTSRLQLPSKIKIWHAHHACEKAGWVSAVGET